ncbi:hypothetical protein BGZ76_001595, partial [Entomortierella beljakovae]
MTMLSRADENISIQELTEKALIKVEKDLNSEILIPTNPLLTDISKLAAEYHRAKGDLASVSLARRSSKVIMKHLRRVKNPYMDPRTIKPIPPFLNSTNEYSATENSSNNSIASVLQSATNAFDGSPITSSESLNVLPSDTTSSTSGHKTEPLDHLPFIFPYSMLQASKADVPIKVEELVKRYHKSRMERIEYTASGSISSNDYNFPSVQ